MGRVPGIRAPGLHTAVEESRIWRDYTDETCLTYLWHGVSVFMMTGWEVFELQDFPFDRQIIDLESFDFVWRRGKDETVYEESMKVIDFQLETESMLPEWHPTPALVTPHNEIKETSDDPGIYP